MTSTTSILWVLVLFTFIQNSRALWPFPPKRFTKSALLDAGSLGLSSGNRVIAFGDFNGDQFTDVATLSSDGHTLTIYLWDHESFVFKEKTSLTRPEIVQNVVPGDFTFDGTLDLLVMGTGGFPGESSLAMSLYIGIPGGTFNPNAETVPSSNGAQPIPLDANGDLKIDLLGITLNTGILSIWRNAYNESDEATRTFLVQDAPFKGQHCTISNPHSNAVVDFDGDCLADVFLMCDDESTGNKYFQIWRNDKSGDFTFVQLGRFPSGVQSVSFADMDRDGTMDIVFTACSSVSSSTGIGSGCSVNIAYNQQLPLCTSTATSGLKGSNKLCRQPEDLCTADPNFKFDLTDSPNNDAFVSIPISNLFPSTSGGEVDLLVLDTTANPAIPLPVKLGDANLDGFPDMLLITSSSPHGGFLGIGETTDRTPHLIYSVLCAKGVIGCDAKGNGRRGWHVVKKDVDVMNTIKDARSVSFFDVDEDGTLDIMVQRTGEQGQGNILFMQNNFFYDAFFLKAIVLNGACNNGWCVRPNSTKYHPFGVSYSGASYKYTVLDTAGSRSAAQVSQLPQTAYQALLTPYAYFGLGRTNNYIENLFVGSTKKQSAEHFINMEGVIPNSKVVIYPPAEDETAWRRELYLRPGAWIPWVTLTIIVTAILLAVIVFVLHLNEKTLLTSNHHVKATHWNRIPKAYEPYPKQQVPRAGLPLRIPYDIDLLPLHRSQNYQGPLHAKWLETAMGVRHVPALALPYYDVLSAGVFQRSAIDADLKSDKPTDVFEVDMKSRDAVVIPGDVAHGCVDENGAFKMGAYPTGAKQWDLNDGGESIAVVDELPASGPALGKDDAGLCGLWSR